MPSVKEATRATREREDICNGHSEASPANRLDKTQKLKYEFKRAV